MKNSLMTLTDKIMLSKRSIIEAIIGRLKNISQFEHSRHRSEINFFTNLIAALSAYSLQHKGPAINAIVSVVYAKHRLLYGIYNLDTIELYGGWTMDLDPVIKAGLC